MSLEAPVQALVACSLCGRVLNQSDVVQIAGNWLCADCKPAYLSRLMASGPAAASPLAWHYGGFWIRFAARILDSFILGIPAGILFLVFLMPAFIRATTDQSRPPDPTSFMFGFLGIFVVFFLATAAYEILMLKYRAGTLGKMICGLKVVRADGRSLTWGVCVGRFCMWNLVISGLPYINTVLMLVSCIMTGTDEEKRGLHDRVCDTRVIYK